MQMPITKKLGWLSLSDKIDFRKKKEYYQIQRHIFNDGLIHQEAIDKYVPNNKASNHESQTLTENKWQIDKSTIELGILTLLFQYLIEQVEE